ncbi:MAG TPA: CoA ester lyase [Clostridiaceae bacterium]|nr:CoA ester lyase [Clostridiaceae bacterium]
MIRSLLFIPGNSPVMLQNGAVLPADALILDLEDAVATDQKDAARTLVASALHTVDYPKEIIVRINSFDSDYWQQDLEEIIPLRPQAIMPTKCSDSSTIRSIAEKISELERQSNIGEGTVKLIPLIETARGVLNAYEIASASPRIVALLLGGEDLTADLQCERTKGGKEIFYSRSSIVIAARAAGVEPIDTPFTDVDDDEGLIEDAKLALSLGFSGKAVISPRHLAAINEIFSPQAEAVKYAREVISAIEGAKKAGKGVASLHGKMIDAPIVSRAKRVLEQARRLGLPLED